MANPVVKYVLKLDDQASKPLKDTGDAAKDASEGTDAASMSMAKLATAAAATVAAVAAVGTAWVKMMQSTADARNDLNDMSIRTGVAAETLSGLKLAAEGSGLELSAFESGLSKLPKRMHDAQGGMKEVLDAFNELGVSFENESGTLRDTDTVFRELAESLAEMENETQRGALATDLLGRSGKNLMQALDGNELEIFINHAREFGTDVGPEASRAAAAWQREVASFTEILGGIAGDFADAFGADGGAATYLGDFNVALAYTAKLVTGFIPVMTSAVSVMIDAQFVLNKPWDLDNWRDLRDSTRDYMDASRELHGRFDEIVAGANKAAVSAREFSDATTGANKPVTGMSGAIRGLASDAEGLKDAVEDAKDEMIEFKKLTEAELMDIEIDLIQYKATTVQAASLMTSEMRRSQLNIEIPEKLGLAGAQLSAVAGGDIIGAAGGAADIFASATGMAIEPYTAAVMGGLEALVTIGEQGAEGIAQTIEDQLGFLIAGLEELPELIPLVTDAIIDAIPEIVQAFIEAAPALFIEFNRALVELPALFAKAIFDGLQSWAQENLPGWGGISLGGGGGGGGDVNAGEWLTNVARATPAAKLAEKLGLGSFQSGGFVPRTQLALLHQGETVIPAGGGGGINISTSVLDRDAIPALVRQIERVYGSFGRASSPLFAGG